MLKEEYGAACKICTRPFTIFRWKADRTAKQKSTGLCLTCARLKNCCQCCMLDLSFGLPIVVRDAALKMVAPGPNSSINREFFAQNNQKAIEDGKGGLEAYEQTDEKARDLLRRLAQTEPYYKKQRRLEEEGEDEPDNKRPKRIGGSGDEAEEGSSYRQSAPSTGTGGKSRYRQDGSSTSSKARPLARVAPPQPQDILPPADRNVKSLFVTGVEDDLPQHEIQKHFQQYGNLRSVVCSHRSHCAFLNYMTRDGAEAAAHACQGRAIVKGVPLRVQWGKPKPLDNMDLEDRMANAKAGRETDAAVKHSSGQRTNFESGESNAAAGRGALAAAAPPGADDVQYASLAGE